MVLRKTKEWMRQFRNPPVNDYFLLSESPHELFLGEVEMMYEHRTGYPGLGANQVLAPLFETVYGDYYRSTTPRSVQYPEELLMTYSFTTWQLERHLVAARIFFGAMPWCGSNLGTKTLAQNRAAFPHYKRYTDMLRTYMDVLRSSAYKRIVVLGERVRDPKNTLAYSFVIPTSPEWDKYRYRIYNLAAQPYVFTAAYLRPDLNELGILMPNWTYEGDNSPNVGTQSFTFEVDPAAHGIPNGTYDLIDVTAQGEVTIATMVPINGKVSFSVTVPALSCKFQYLKRVGP